MHYLRNSLHLVPGEFVRVSGLWRMSLSLSHGGVNFPTTKSTSSAPVVRIVTEGRIQLVRLLPHSIASTDLHPVVQGHMALPVKVEIRILDWGEDITNNFNSQLFYSNPVNLISHY